MWPCFWAEECQCPCRQLNHDWSKSLVLRVWSLDQQQLLAEAVVALVRNAKAQEGPTRDLLSQNSGAGS